jgi:hypothetical protein
VDSALPASIEKEKECSRDDVNTASSFILWMLLFLLIQDITILLYSHIFFFLSYSVLVDFSRYIYFFSLLCHHRRRRFVVWCLFASCAIPLFLSLVLSRVPITIAL